MKMFFVFSVWTISNDSWDASQKKGSDGWNNRVYCLIHCFGNASVTKYDLPNLLTLTTSSRDREGIGCLEAPLSSLYPWSSFKLKIPLLAVITMATAARGNKCYYCRKSEKVGVCSMFCSERNFCCVSLHKVCVFAPGCHRYCGMSSDCVLSGCKESPRAVPSLAG